jgi:hypothetical protein
LLVPFSFDRNRAVYLLRGAHVSKTMAFEVIDRLFVVVYGTVDVTDEEWAHYLQVVDAYGVDLTTQLIFTDGGGPSASQCKYLNDMLAGRSPPVAIVSANAEVRGVVAALSWFNRNIRAFPPIDLRGAIAYLEIPESRLAFIEKKARRLRLLVSTDERGAA